MRDQIELSARRQRRGELDGVLDRALRQVVMLEGENPIGKSTFERLPVVGGNFLQSAEAAGRRRSRAVNENQQGAFLGVLPARRRQRSRDRSLDRFRAANGRVPAYGRGDFRSPT